MVCFCQSTASDLALALPSIGAAAELDLSADSQVSAILAIGASLAGSGPPAGPGSRRSSLAGVAAPVDIFERQRSRDDFGGGLSARAGAGAIRHRSAQSGAGERFRPVGRDIVGAAVGDGERECERECVSAAPAPGRSSPRR